MAFYHRLAMHQRMAEAGAEKRQASKLERLGKKGRMDQLVLSALEGQKQTGRMALEKSKQKFKKPLQAQMIKAGGVDINKALFDLKMGKAYTPGLLSAKTSESAMFTGYLKARMKELTVGGEEEGLAPLKSLGRGPLSGSIQRRNPLQMRLTSPLGTKKRKELYQRWYGVMPEVGIRKDPSVLLEAPISRTRIPEPGVATPTKVKRKPQKLLPILPFGD